MVFTGIAATVKIATSSTQSILFKRNVDQALRKHSSDDDEELEYLAVADVLYQKQKRGRLTGVPNPITSAGTKVMQMTGGDHRICVVVRAANQKTGTAKVVIVLLKPAKKGQVTQDGELPLDTCHTDASFRANRGAGMLSTEPGDALKVVKSDGEDATYMLEDTDKGKMQRWNLCFQLQILDHAAEGGYDGSTMKELLNTLAESSLTEEIAVVSPEGGSVGDKGSGAELFDGEEQRAEEENTVEGCTKGDGTWNC